MAYPPYLLAAYAITLLSVLIADFAAPSSDPIAALKLACIVAFAWHAAPLLRNQALGKGAAALAAAIGLLWSALGAMHLYKVVAMAPLDFSMVVPSIDDARRTLVHVGEYGVSLAVGALAVNRGRGERRGMGVALEASPRAPGAPAAQPARRSPASGYSCFFSDDSSTRPRSCLFPAGLLRR